VRDHRYNSWRFKLKTVFAARGTFATDALRSTIVIVIIITMLLYRCVCSASTSATAHAANWRTCSNDDVTWPAAVAATGDLCYNRDAGPRRGFQTVGALRLRTSTVGRRRRCSDNRRFTECYM